MLFPVTTPKKISYIANSSTNSKEKVSDILIVRNTKRIIHFVRNLDNPKQYVPRYDILGLGDIVNYFYQKKSKVKRRPTYFKKKQSASSSLSSNKTPDHRGIDIHIR